MRAVRTVKKKKSFIVLLVGQKKSFSLEKGCLFFRKKD